MRTRQPSRNARRGSAYISVAGVAILVSMISLSAMHLARLELRSAVALNEMAYAQRLAHSSVEFALGQMSHYQGGLLEPPHWRNHFDHNIEESISPTGFQGQLSFRILDHADGDLADDPNDAVEIQGIGRWGGAIHVYSVTYARGPGDPLSVRAFDTVGDGFSLEQVNRDNWYSQYFVPNQLPPEATAWAVTSVEVLISKNGPEDETLDVSLYHPNGSLQPGTLIEMLSVGENDLPSEQNQWHEFVFSTASDLDPTQGLCLTLTTSDTAAAAELGFESGGVSEADTHLTTGSQSGWDGTNVADSSLYFRVHGTYTTASGESGEFQIEPGSWNRIAAP